MATTSRKRSPLTLSDDDEPNSKRTKLSVNDEQKLLIQCETHTKETQLPTIDEIQTACPESLVRNMIKGPFPDTSNYLAIFADLIREDFIDPLREKLKKIKNKSEFAHEGVRLKCCIPVRSTHDTRDSVLCRLNIKERINRETSKQFTGGNLLCLSEDDFETVLFATIIDRNDLREQKLTVSLIGKAAQDASFTSPKKEYEMFETPSYYEAYAPVFKRLESMQKDPAQLPFQDYFVKVQTKVKKPSYWQEDTTLDLRGVICSCEHTTCDHCSIGFDTLQNQQIQLNKSDTYLDKSQIAALCTALTRELVLIQGPPGTGKTYIGLKIVQSLLINKSVWAPSESVPIVVVCYTNHALDQFLEGLIKIEDFKSLKIRRLGGQCKNKAIEPYNVKNFLKDACRRDRIRVNSHWKLLTLQKHLEALEDLLDGKFPSTERACKMYSSILSQKIIHQLYEMCRISTTLPDFSGLKQRRAQDYSYYNEIEANRQVTFDYDFDAYDSQDMFYESRSLGKFVSYFKTVFPLSEKRAEEFLQKTEIATDQFLHLQLFKYCLFKLKDAWQSKAEETASTCEKDDKLREMIRVNCLQEADVIGVTTTGAAKYNTALTQLKSKICVIEEAAEVLEPHVISSLTTHTKQLILIGDHKQLRPKPSSYKIGHTYKLEVSLFERLANNGFPMVTLNVQYRMRPEISRLVSHNIYNGELTDSPTVRGYEKVRGMQYNLFFVDHCEPEAHFKENVSYKNHHEANFVVSLSTYLLQNGYKPEEITILTPYSEQVSLVRKHEEFTREIHVTTIDDYQGEENEIILLSMVRSNCKHRVGFTKEDNRVCVAISRAKVGFYCIGNFSMYRMCSKLWRSILNDLEQPGCIRLLSDTLPLQCKTHENITRVARANDFVNVPKGGCSKICGLSFPACNHNVCQEKCHPDYHKHDNPPCQQPCPKRCEQNLHKCKGSCGEICPPCRVPIQKQIPNCGHNQQVPCHILPSDYCCKMKCDKKLPCGHQCKLSCGEDCESKPCAELVKKTWPCGHKAERECNETDLSYSFTCKAPCDATLACSHKCTGTCGECNQGRLHVPCKERCPKTLVCGHISSGKCAKNNSFCHKKCLFKCYHGPCEHQCSTQCSPCLRHCRWRCRHHKCRKKCGEPCDRPRCNKPCKKKLKSCIHDCIGLCGEPCPDVCKICDRHSEAFIVSKAKPNACFVQLVDCKHVFEVTSFDKWVDSAEFENDWIRCPKCATPIITTYRYANRIKEIRDMLNDVKAQNSTCHMLTEKEREDFDFWLPHVSVKVQKMVREFTDISFSLKASLEKWLSRVERINVRKASDAMLECTCMLLLSVFQSLHSIELLRGDRLTPIINEYLRSKVRILIEQAIRFLEWIASCFPHQPFSIQLQNDLQSERKRILLLREFYLICSFNNPAKFRDNCKLKSDTTDSESDSEHSLYQQLREYECLGNKLKELSEDFFEKAFTHLQTKDRIFLISKKRRATTNEMLCSLPGSWLTDYEKKNYFKSEELPGNSPEIGGYQNQLLYPRSSSPTGSCTSLSDWLPCGHSYLDMTLDTELRSYLI